MISVINGILLARRMKGVSGTVGVASLGDGGTSTGAFHEGMNQAGVERLPLVMLVANNQFAYSTPNAREFACEDLAARARGYGFAEHRVDGTDLAACLQVLGAAVAAARDGAGPQMVVAQLLRMCGHGEHDDASYISTELKQSAVGRDCLRFAEETILKNGWVHAAGLEALRSEVVQQVEETLATVQREPPPDPYREEWAAIATSALLDNQPEPVPAVERRGLLDLP
jgi:pyruvate dehydrogenase E1 component alpha subunit/2-oxoisovalerate dehydrogenase E1 component alpha subunit